MHLYINTATIPVYWEIHCYRHLLIYDEGKCLSLEIVCFLVFVDSSGIYTIIYNYITITSFELNLCVLLICTFLSFS